MKGVSMVKMLKRSLVAFALSLIGSFNPWLAYAQQTGKVVYVGIGGPTQEAIRKSLFEPFQKETGIQVVEDTGLASERVQAEVQSGRPTIDFLTIGTGAYLTLLGKNLLAPIDYKYYAPEDL